MVDQAIEIMRRGVIAVPEGTLVINNLPVEFRELYQEMVRRAIDEFPPIEGFSVMHSMLVERLAFSYVNQKIQDSKLDTDVNWKSYKINFGQFLRTCETLLREAKAISIEKSFKAQFIQDVLEIIDRCVTNQKEKALIARELKSLVRK